MEKVEGSARPAWLAEDQPAAAAPAKPEPVPKAVPWRTPGSPKAAVPTAKPATAKPAAKSAVAAVVAPVRQPARRGPFWERLVPLVFLLIFVLVVGGYLAGWHLG